MSFNSAAEACQRSLHWQGAIQILDLMSEDTVQPDIVTVSLVSSPLEISGKTAYVPPLLFVVPALGFAEDDQSEQMTALELLVEHDTLSSCVAHQFNDWRPLRSKLEGLSSRRPSAGEKSAGRLLDHHLNRYFSLGVYFTDRALDLLFPASGWTDSAREHARRNTGTWSQEASAHGLAAWTQFAVRQMDTSTAGAGAAYGYGHADASLLLPVMVQHDRSRCDWQSSIHLPHSFG